jgi:rare lipoprotein A
MSTSSALWAIPLVSLMSGASSPKIVTDTFNQPISYNSAITNQDKSFESSYLLASKKSKYVIEFRSKSANEWMIMVNNQPAFLVKDLPKAMITAAQLSMTMNAVDFDPNRLEAVALKGEYIGKYENVVLFKIPKAEVVNPSLNLTQWINNLRVSAGAEPLTLVEAQKQMYRLATTNEQIDGLASWYGPYFQGRQTASGEQFEQQDFTAAHQSLPFDTYLKVTNQQNGRSIVVRINDRGPYVGDRNLDLSQAAAIAIKSDQAGVVPIVATILVANN